MTSVDRPALLRPRTGLAVLFFLFVLGYVVLATDLHEEARRAPLLFGVPTLVLAAINVVREFRNQAGPEGEAEVANAARTQAAAAGAGEAEADRAASRAIARHAREAATPLRAYLWLLGFTGVFVVLGQTVGFLLGSTAFLRFEGSRSWLVSVVYSLVLTVSVWLFFVEFLGVRHYRGLLDLPM